MWSNRFNLENKTILVTGASSGLGKAVALLAAELGAKIILVGRNEQRLLSVRNEMKNSENHQCLPCDLSTMDNIKEISKYLTKKSTLLNGFVHAAGINLTMPARYITEKNLDDIFSLNVKAAFLLTKELTKKKLCELPYSIVFFTSVLGLVGQAGASGYSASKGALVTMTKSLALEYSALNIRVNCIAPGTIQTPMADEFFGKLTEEQKQKIIEQHPLGLGEPEDVAYSTCFLLSEAARWITGTCLTVDGGYTAA